MHTMSDVTALANCSAVTAIDQIDAFDDSVSAHLINLIDTLMEHRTTLERGTGRSFGTITKAALDVYNAKAQSLQNAKPVIG